MSRPEDIASELSEIKAGEVPYEIFTQLARLSVVPVIEVVPLHVDQIGNMYTLLSKRPANDTLWPNLFGVPGTILISTDRPGSFEDAYDRILTGKLSGIETTPPTLVRPELVATKRGLELALIHRVSIVTATGLDLSNVNQLPSAMIENHESFIELAVDDWMQG